jgi:drug/metabolite transporter (DMT)-like permease
MSSDVDTVLSFGFAALAACGNAVANVMQRKASLEGASEQPFGWQVLRGLVRRTTWLLGFGGMVASFLFQAVALDLGQLSAVEPVITLEVPLTLLVASRVFRVRIGKWEWSGIWAMTAGMILLVAVLNPHPGNEGDVSHVLYLLAGGSTAGLIVVLIAAAQRGPTRWRTACLGAAAGTCFGLTATLIKEVMSQLSHHGIVGLVTTWQTYAAISAGIGGVVVMQWALHTGPLLAAQPGFTLLDPLVSIMWGVLVYNEATRTGPWLVLAVVGALGIGAGVMLLARSPLLSAADEHSLASIAGTPVQARAT